MRQIAEIFGNDPTVCQLYVALLGKSLHLRKPILELRKNEARIGATSDLVYFPIEDWSEFIQKSESALQTSLRDTQTPSEIL